MGRLREQNFGEKYMWSMQNTKKKNSNSRKRCRFAKTICIFQKNNVNLPLFFEFNPIKNKNQRHLLKHTLIYPIQYEQYSI